MDNFVLGGQTMMSSRGPRSWSSLRGVAAALLFLAVARWANAQAFSLVHEFSGRGGSPGELIRGSDGNLYGAATSGGDSGRGAVFVLTPDGGGGYAY